MKKLMKFFWISVFVITIMLLNINGIIASERPLRNTTVWPAYIDPAIGYDTTSSIALVNLYDALVFSDVKGEALPHVAESWKVSDDGLTWTFYIRKGIKFHDGSELIASDVKFSFDRFRTIGRGNAFLFLGQKMSIEVVDPYTLTFYLEKPSGPFLKTLLYFYILNEDLVRANIKKTDEYGELGDYGKEYLLTHDAGSGAYMVKDVEVGSSIDMVVNPNYWIPIDSHAPDEFKMIGTVEPVTVRTLLSKRELEIGDQNQSLENLAALKKIEGIEIAQYSTAAQWDLMMHTRKPPTDDIHFRKAMAWATDYDAVVNQILIGFIQAKGPIPQVLSSHDPTLFQYHRNLDKAMEELKQSKYYGQLEKYPVELHWVAEVPDEEKIALLFMSNMADIGIKVKVVKTPWMSLVNETSSMETSPNITIVFPSSRYAEAGSLLDNRYTSKSASSVNSNEWLLDPTYDAMLEDAIQTVDIDERYAKYNKLQQFIVDLCPTIFLCDQTNRRPFQSSYVDWYVDKPFSPVMGYDFVIRNIKIYPEKRAALLK
jgi:peptide/nickel transport system substrate-binding protein